MWQRWRRADTRVRLAMGALAIVVVGWPLTAVLQALGVPLFEQVMLALSWLAPAYTAVDMMMTARLSERARKDQEKPGA